MRTPAHSLGQPPPLPATLSTGGAVKQFLSNSAKLAGQCGANMLQDPRTLQRNSLIISTLVLVLSRIGTANASAIRAKNTPEQTHREKEAIKTTIRELGGWTLGYIVFRAIEHAAKTYLQNALQYRTNQESSFKTLMQGLRSEWGKMRGKASAPLKDLPVKMPQAFGLLNPAGQKLSIPAAEKALKNWGIPESAKKLLGKVCLDRAPDALKKLERLNTWGPLIAGGIPAVLLSGFVLEWFTQNHAQKVIDAVSRAKNGEAAVVAPAQVLPGDRAFNAYLQQIQTKRSQRGIN